MRTGHLFCNFDKFILKIKNWTNARSIFIDIWTSVILSQFDVSFLLGRSWTRSCFPPQKVSSFLSLFVALTANFLWTCWFSHHQGGWFGFIFSRIFFQLLGIIYILTLSLSNLVFTYMPNFIGLSWHLIMEVVLFTATHPLLWKCSKSS